MAYERKGKTTVHSSKTPQADAQSLKKIRQEAAAGGVKPSPKNKGGRPLGSLRGSEDARAKLAEGMISVFGHLTEAEIQQVKPIDVFRLVTIAAVRADDFAMAMAAAERWAPYVHAKLAPKVVETDEPAIIIKGGLPERPRQVN